MWIDLSIEELNKLSDEGRNMYILRQNGEVFISRYLNGQFTKIKIGRMFFEVVLFITEPVEILSLDITDRLFEDMFMMIKIPLVQNIMRIMFGNDTYSTASKYLDEAGFLNSTYESSASEKLEHYIVLTFNYYRDLIQTYFTPAVRNVTLELILNDNV